MFPNPAGLLSECLADVQTQGVELSRRVGNRHGPIDAPDFRLEILRHLFQAFEGFFSCSVQMMEKICHEIYCARCFIALEFSFFPVVEHRAPC